MGFRNVLWKNMMENGLLETTTTKLLENIVGFFPLRMPKKQDWFKEILIYFGQKN